MFSCVAMVQAGEIYDQGLILHKQILMTRVALRKLKCISLRFQITSNSLLFLKWKFKEDAFNCVVSLGNRRSVTNENLAFYVQMTNYTTMKIYLPNRLTVLPATTRKKRNNSIWREKVMAVQFWDFKFLIWFKPWICGFFAITGSLVKVSK